MSVFVLTSPTVFVDEFDMTAVIDRAGTQQVSVEQVERKRAAGGGFKFFLPGLATVTSEVVGYCDPDDPAIQDLTPANRLTRRIVSTTATAPAAEGEPLWAHRGYFAAVTGAGVGAGPVGELATFQFTTQSDTPPISGVVGMPHASYDDGGFTGDGVALTGPTAAQSLYAVLHVTAAAGTNLAVKVQSDDNSGFTSATDRITFSTVSAVSAQWGSVAGNLSTETHWRVVATVASGDFEVLVGFGVA